MATSRGVAQRIFDAAQTFELVLRKKGCLLIIVFDDGEVKCDCAVSRVRSFGAATPIRVRLHPG